MKYIDPVKKIQYNHCLRKLDKHIVKYAKYLIKSFNYKR